MRQSIVGVLGLLFLLSVTAQQRKTPRTQATKDAFTREIATQLLSPEEFSHQGVSVPFVAGSFERRQGRSNEDYKCLPLTSSLKILQNAGFVSVEKDNRAMTIKVTPSGETAFERAGAKSRSADFDAGDGHQCRYVLYFIPLAYKQFIGVTGVSFDGTRAVADYAWRWRPTSVGEAFMKGNPAYDRLSDNEKLEVDSSTIPLSPGSRVERARFRLFDDGWRLEP